MSRRIKDDISMFSNREFELPIVPARSESPVPVEVSYRIEDESRMISVTNGRTPSLTCVNPLNIPESPENTGWTPETKHDKEGDKSYMVDISEVIGKENNAYAKFGKRNNHSLKHGPFGLCGDSSCIRCSASFKMMHGYSRCLRCLSNKDADADGWAKKLISFLSSKFQIMDPHSKIVQRWNKFFVISCLVATFVDPLFFYIMGVELDNKCMITNWSFAIGISIVRSVTDFVYLLHMLLQFRLAYVAPESLVVGTGDFVDDPKKIAVRYLCGYFTLDLFGVFPLPQVMMLIILPRYIGSSSADFGKNLLRATVLLQYVARTKRCLPLIAGQSASGFIFESAWTNFFINILMYLLAGHVVGCCWYLFSLQRVKQCLYNACYQTQIPSCDLFMDCGNGNYVNTFSQVPSWQDWLSDSNSTSCFSATGNFQYGIYQNGVLLATENSIIRRYLYSLAWGFLQISTFGNNLVPSYFEWEVIFVVAIITLGLLLFALLIGNMQNFLQALGSRGLEMQLRQRDVEHWMSHRRLPGELRRQVRQAERFRWAAFQGVNEERLLENLPEGLQREVRRHFFELLKKVRIFSLMDEPILDAFYKKLRHKLFIRGSDVFYGGSPIESIVFIVRGKLESIGADGHTVSLSEGDVCGEELLAWSLEHSSVSRDGGKVRFPGQQLFSSRTVRCSTNVEAFTLHASDLEQVTASYTRFLRSPRVQGAIRYESPYWRTYAAGHIQAAWRYRRKLLKKNTSSGHESSTNISHAWSDLLKQMNIRGSARFVNLFE